MQYCIFSFILFHVSNIVKYEFFVFFMDECGLCLIIVSHWKCTEPIHMSLRCFAALKF